MRRLFRRRIITRLRINPERWQSLWRKEFHFYFTPFAVAHWVLWTVSEQVLVAQLNTYFRGDIREIVRVINGKGPPASQFRDIAEQGGAQPFFIGRKEMIVDADRINEDVRFLHHGPDLALGVAAVVVAPIGDDQQSFLRIARLAHLADAQVDGVKQRRASLGDGIDQLPLNVLHGSGEVRNLFRLIRKGNHEELILRIGRLEELDYSLASALDLAAHAAAHVENYTQGYRSVFTGEGLDLLLFLALEQVEILSIKSCHQPIHGVSDGHGNEHHLHVHAERLGVALEGRINFCRFRGGTGLDMYVFGRVLSEDVKRTEGRYHQESCPYRPKRTLLCVQHRPHTWQKSASWR